jgi:hypothetical protein
VPDFLVGETTLNPAGEYYPVIPAGWRRITEPAFSAIWSSVNIRQSRKASLSVVLGLTTHEADGTPMSSQHGRTPPRGIKPVLGLDVAEMGVDSNVLCFRYGGYVAPLEQWSEIDLNRTAEIAGDHAVNRNAQFIAVDGTGVGAGIASRNRN